MIWSHIRGHSVEFREGKWYYSDTGELAIDNRPCVRCNKFPTKEGYDACLGYIPGVTSACCGHGVEESRIIAVMATQRERTDKDDDFGTSTGSVQQQ